MKKKVSFDFDSTLTRLDVQDFCIDLIKKGFDIWIVTSRYSDLESWKRFNLKESNKDLFRLAKKLGILESNINFTNMSNKSEFFENNNDFIFHLDDDSIEIEFISRDTQVKAILCKSNNWLNECIKLI